MDRITAYKDAINKARAIYDDMTGDELQVIEAWLDSEYNNLEGSKIDSTILSQV